MMMIYFAMSTQPCGNYVDALVESKSGGQGYAGHRVGMSLSRVVICSSPNVAGK